MMSLLSPQLEAFLAVVKNKTVHAAAAEIHLTQTAVTQRIRTLESSLRTTLFIRTRRGMNLTPEGEALLRYCHATQELEGEALATIQGAATQAEVTMSISAPTSIMRSRIVPGCLPVLQNFPNLLLHFQVSDVEKRHQTLRSGQCDFAIIQEEDLAHEMQSKKLLPEKYVLVCSSKWHGRKLRDIVQQERIIDFDLTDKLTFNYLKQNNLFENVNHSRHYVNSTENLALLVANGVGYTTLAKEFAQPYVDSNELIILNRGKTLDVTPILAWYDRPEPPAYFTALLEAIQ